MTGPIESEAALDALLRDAHAAFGAALARDPGPAPGPPPEAEDAALDTLLWEAHVAFGTAIAAGGTRDRGDATERLAARLRLLSFAAMLEQGLGEARQVAEGLDQPWNGVIARRLALSVADLRGRMRPFASLLPGLDERMGAAENAAEEVRRRWEGSVLGTVDRSETARRARDTVRWLTAAATQVDAAANEFRGADLRSAPMDVVSLEGIRWDEATRWPPEWEERVRRASVANGDGTYTVRAWTDGVTV